MADWIKTKTPGVYVSHSLKCPVATDPRARCRCEPSWRGRRRCRGLGKLASRVTKAWSQAGLTRITLHECRHTYASLLRAAGYTVKELMEHMGHADLQMVTRYVKLLPQPGEDDAADRLDAYLPRAAAARP